MFLWTFCYSIPPQGTFVDADDLKGVMRLLAEKYEPDYVVKRTFNFDPL